MSIIRNIIKIFNGSGWDEYHPKTDSSQVSHTHADYTVNDLETDLQGTYICIGYQVQSISGYAIAAGGYDEDQTISASLVSGTDYFTSVPIGGSHGMCAENFSFNQSTRQLSFSPYNAGSAAVSNGTLRFLNTCYKQI